MDHAARLLFANWQNFYVIVGSAAGALTGLQFVVITLIAQTRTAGSRREIRAFGTPTVVHFCTALLVSGLMEVPWPGILHFGVCLAVCSAIGVIYSISIVWHARKAAYNPDVADWFWFAALPLIAHVSLGVAAVLVWRNLSVCLFIIAADTLLFLFTGIHNSWDTVTYITLKWRANEGS